MKQLKKQIRDKKKELCKCRDYRGQVAIRQDLERLQKELKKKRAEEQYPSAAYRISAEITKRTGQEVRVTVPGHVQRGGAPDAYDRFIATRLGAKAAELILNEEYGYMVCMRNNTIDKIPLEKVAGKTKMMDANDDMIKQVKALGICLGD